VQVYTSQQNALQNLAPTLELNYNLFNRIISQEIGKKIPHHAARHITLTSLLELQAVEVNAKVFYNFEELLFRYKIKKPSADYANLRELAAAIPQKMLELQKLTFWANIKPAFYTVTQERFYDLSELTTTFQYLARRYKIELENLDLPLSIVYRGLTSKEREVFCKALSKR
jgi:hypothetical protein